jgi:hypothetical protein
MVHYLKLRGACPSKKNCMERITIKGVRTLGINKAAKAKLDSLQLQLQCLWKRQPLIHPNITVKFTASNDAADNDGMLVSTMDLLQPRAGNLILNDNIRFANGRTIIEPADICAVGDEMVELWIDDKCG